jgi:hypothetical protein
MSKVLSAEYDNTTHSLHLLEPLEGFANREKVSVVVRHAEAKKPWSGLEGILTGEDGESFARAIEEAFPIEPILQVITRFAVDTNAVVDHTRKERQSPPQIN